MLSFCFVKIQLKRIQTARWERVEHVVAVHPNSKQKVPEEGSERGKKKRQATKQGRSREERGGRGRRRGQARGGELRSRWQKCRSPRLSGLGVAICSRMQVLPKCLHGGVTIGMAMSPPAMGEVHRRGEQCPSNKEPRGCL